MVILVFEATIFQCQAIEESKLRYWALLKILLTKLNLNNNVNNNFIK